MTPPWSLPGRQCLLGWMVIFQWNVIIRSRWLPSQSLLGFGDAALIFVRAIFGWVPVPLVVICCALAYAFIFPLLRLIVSFCSDSVWEHQTPQLLLQQAAMTHSNSFHRLSCTLKVFSIPITPFGFLIKSMVLCLYLFSYLLWKLFATNCYCSAVTFYFSLSWVTHFLKCLFSSHSSHSTLFLSCLQYLVWQHPPVGQVPGLWCPGLWHSCTPMLGASPWLFVHYPRPG